MPARLLATRRLASVLLLPAALLAPAGCQTAGPGSIATGRALYNEVLTRTGDEQVLDMIVHCRYDETFGMLEVASVTSQVHVGASTEVNAGIGPDSSFDGNLVPFAAGVSYEETPTISYVPMSGEEFITRLVAPVSLVQALTLSQLSRVRGQTFDLMVSRMNGLRNLSGPGVADPKFERMQALLQQLDEQGHAEMVATGDEHFLYLYGYGGEHADAAREVLELLGLTAFKADGQALLIPVRPGLGMPPKGDAILIETRSVLDLVRQVGDTIEVPAEHLEAGIVGSVPPAAADVAPFVRIRSARERPKTAAVAVTHHGWWFYIDATDIASKRDFVLLRAVLRMGLENPLTTQSSPVLTIPASR